MVSIMHDFTLLGSRVGIMFADMISHILRGSKGGHWGLETVGKEDHKIVTNLIMKTVGKFGGRLILYVSLGLIGIPKLQVANRCCKIFKIVFLSLIVHYFNTLYTAL